MPAMVAGGMPTTRRGCYMQNNSNMSDDGDGGGADAGPEATRGHPGNGTRLGGERGGVVRLRDRSVAATQPE